MREILTRGLEALGVDLDRLPALEEFSRRLLERNQVMNLTAITDPAEVATLHFLDSLCLLPMAEWTGKAVVDVGTGAGFPGMPLAIVRPDAAVTLLDSLGKRVKFLEECRDALGLRNVTCVHARAEEFAAGHREGFDIAVSRAVAALPVLCELCLPLVRAGGQILAKNSSHTGEEIASAEKAIALLGGRIGAVRDYTIPGSDVVHRVVVIDKVSPTPKKYPRRFAQIKKQPIGSPPADKETPGGKTNLTQGGTAQGSDQRGGLRQGGHRQNLVRCQRGDGAGPDGAPHPLPGLRRGTAESGYRPMHDGPGRHGLHRRAGGGRHPGRRRGPPPPAEAPVSSDRPPHGRMGTGESGGLPPSDPGDQQAV